MAAAKKEGFVVPELRREREASKLDLPELTTYVDGGEWITEKRRAMCKDVLIAVNVCWLWVGHRRQTNRQTHSRQTNL